jgi:hypothetical protein
MPTEEMTHAGQYLQELKKRLIRSQELAKHEIPAWLQQQAKEPNNDLPADHPDNDQSTPPAAFQESSYLYIRSYDADSGERPLPGSVEFWNSPDIRVSPLTAASAYTKTLEAGETYLLECTLRNRGDLMVPSANVEFFLTNPTLGFNTKFAKRIGTTSGWLDSMGSTKVAIKYRIPGTEGGHKCLFARAFSFSPLDIPLDDFQLLPLIDRHVAQLNLMIVPQTSLVFIDLVHMLNAKENITLIAMDPNQMLSLRHPFLADFDVTHHTAHQSLGRIQPEIIHRRQEDTNGEVTLERDFLSHGSFSSFSFSSQHPGGMDTHCQAEITRATLAAVEQVDAEQAKQSAFRDIFRAYREMSEQMQVTQFALQLPSFGLQPGQAVGIQIRNTNNITQQTKGGITLIVTG